MKNNATRILVSHLSHNPGLVNLSCPIKEVINKSILDHSNHLLVLALAAAALDYVDWQAIEETFEAIKNKD